MNELQIFNNEEFGQIRVIEQEGEPWFVGKDVAQALGYSDTFGALKKHVDEADRQNCQNDSFETPRGMTIINESGLYALVFGSKLESARRFKHWVTHDVLPSIRRNGMYATDELLDNPDFAIQVFERLKEERARNRKLESDVSRMRPKEIFADAVSVTDQTILIGDLAKMIKQNGVDIGQKRLFAWMRDNGYLIRRKGADWNSPTQKSMEMGLFKIKETAVTHSDGHVTINKTTKVTGKGQQYFVNRFLADKGDQS